MADNNNTEEQQEDFEAAEAEAAEAAEAEQQHRADRGDFVEEDENTSSDPDDSEDEQEDSEDSEDEQEDSEDSEGTDDEQEGDGSEGDDSEGFDEHGEPSNKWIPKGRFNELVIERNELREKLATLTEEKEKSSDGQEGEPDTGKELSITDKIRELSGKKFDLDRDSLQAWEEGDEDEYRKIKMEMQGIEDEIIDLKASVVVKSTLDSIKTEGAEEDAIGFATEMMEIHPELNDERSPQYMALKGLTDAYMGDGDSIDTALAKAYEHVYPEDKQDEDNQEKRRPTGNKRRASQIRKNAKAAKQQPHRMVKGSGQRDKGGTIPISEMTDEQYSQWKKTAEYKDVRGDYL